MLPACAASSGQNGSQARSAHAAQAIATRLPIWHHARATAGRGLRRPQAAPAAPPSPRPMRNTARITENAYTVALKTRLRIRVQTTSAASAQNPESAIDRWIAVDAKYPGPGTGGWGPGARD